MSRNELKGLQLLTEMFIDIQEEFWQSGEKQHQPMSFYLMGP